MRHEHWLFGERPQDDSDTRRLGQHGAAKAMFDERKLAGFPNDYEPVISC